MMRRWNCPLARCLTRSNNVCGGITHDLRRKAETLGKRCAEVRTRRMELVVAMRNQHCLTLEVMQQGKRNRGQQGGEREQGKYAPRDLAAQ